MNWVRRHGAVYLTALVLIVGAGSYALSLHALSVSQHRWCGTLGLLTSRPAPRVPPPGPDATAAQKDAYRTWLFYGDLVRLRRGYGCG